MVTHNRSIELANRLRNQMNQATRTNKQATLNYLRQKYSDQNVENVTHDKGISFSAYVDLTWLIENINLPEGEHYFVMFSIENLGDGRHWGAARFINFWLSHVED
jgi:hypothetical protein